MCNALDLIGNTPIVKLRKLTSDSDANVYVKCEYLNPSGSIKDRMALKMIQEAEREGKLQRDGTIVDATSGNTGPALSFVGAMKNHRVKLLIPAKWAGQYNPENRIRIMECFGADVQAFSTKGYEKLLEGLSPSEASAAIFAIGMKKCYDMEREDSKVWWANQMCNINNAQANHLTTGPEILEQLDGEVDALVASIGTGGTILGIAESLLEELGHLSVIGLEPGDARVTEWFTTGSMNKYMNAVGFPPMKSIVEVMLERGLPDEIWTVADNEARVTMNRLSREEGLFCGMSSGANVYAALKVAKKLGRGANVVTVLVDRRERYFPEAPHEHYVI
ncbi:MAG TPA: cysteine synthase family protein [Methylomirabilota bacterium]|nr:cysteine synthase family protein [Methylomirabilota bacterium]